MSRCMTLRHTGLSDGISTVSTYRNDNPLAVELSSEEWCDYSREESRIITKPIQVWLDRFKPPAVEADGLLREASIRSAGKHTYLVRARTSKPGILVYIDTAHTEPSVGGGEWRVLSGNPREIAKGRRGFRHYTVRPRGGVVARPLWSGDEIAKIDEQTCYDVGLLLLLPGDWLEVTFHAPGILQGILGYRPTGNIEFRLTRNEVEEDYEYQLPNYQAEQDLDDTFGSVGRFNFSSSPYDDW